MGAKLTISGACWQHVHPHDGSVYDFSYWRIQHPGNEQFSAAANPIAARAKAGAFSISFPYHPSI